MTHVPDNLKTGKSPDSSRSTRPPFSWAALLVCVFCLLAGAIELVRPPLPKQIVLDAIFPVGREGRLEPLITTGDYGNGDLLDVKYVGPNSAQFSYDAWGSGGPTSKVFTYAPGTAVRLAIEMPSIAETADPTTGHRRSLRVTINGEELLDTTVDFHRLPENKVYFGLNGIGGSGENRFSGALRTPDGRSVSGWTQAYFSRAARALAVLRDGLLLAEIAVLGVLAGFLFPVLRKQVSRFQLRQPMLRETGAHPLHFWIPAGVAIVAFGLVLTGGTGRLIYPESFGNFYDYQAQSLLHGRLDVPPEALSGEAFVVHGKFYGYFGPTPALIRIPFVAGHLLFGELSRPLMLAYFIVTLLAARALLFQAVRLTRGRDAAPSGWGVALFVVCIGLGSTLFFLSSRAYIYHEANLCGAMFALWAVYWSLRYLDVASMQSAVLSLVLGLLSLHARPPTGLFALCVLGSVALIHLCRALRHTWQRRHDDRPACNARGFVAPLTVGCAAVLGILSFNALSYAKFQTFDGAPLKYHIQYNAERLARFDGKNFHAINIPHNFYTYFLARSLHTKWHFPWFSIRGDNGWSMGERMDMEEPTLSVPLAMPGLFALVLLGLTAGILLIESTRLPLLVLSLGFAPPLLALLAAVATSNRYTSDMCPFLIGAAAYGLVTIESLAPRARRCVLIVVSALAVLSVFITLGITLYYQAEGVWGVPASVTQSYHHLRDVIDHLLGLR